MKCAAALFNAPVSLAHVEERPAIPTLDFVRARRQEILRAAEECGVSSVRVFGSVARGDSHRGSDVDLLVDYDVLERGLGPLAAFRDRATDILGPFQVDAAAPALLRPEVLIGALQDALDL